MYDIRLMIPSKDSLMINIPNTNHTDNNGDENHDDNGNAYDDIHVLMIIIPKITMMIMATILILITLLCIHIKSLITTIFLIL